MKVLFLPKHEYMGASSRYRTLQYIPFLKEKNIDYDISPLFSDEYLKYKYENGKENKLITIKRILKRIKTILIDAPKYDVLVIEKELIPYFPPLLEYYLKFRKISYIVDYDDAVWHNYDKHRIFLVRAFLKYKIKTVMDNATTIIGGSEYIIDYAKHSKCQNIVKIPTVIDIEKYKCNKTYNEENLFILGWIGSPSSSQYILEINDMLKNFTTKYNAIVHLVGFDKKLANKLDFKYKIIPWSEKSEVEEICKFNVGIMPLSDTPFERGKCGFKLIQYMGCNKTVIASSVGENNHIIKDNKTGFLVRNNNEWFNTLVKLYNSKKLCIEMGNLAYESILNNYSLHAVQNKYLDTIMKEKK